MTTYSYTIHTPLMDEVMGGFRAEFASDQLFTGCDLLGDDLNDADSIPVDDLKWVFQFEGDFPLAYDGGFCVEVETSDGDYFELTPFGLSGWEPMFDPAEMTIKEQLELRKQNEEEQGA